MSEENSQDLGEVTLMVRALQNGDKEKIDELIPATIIQLRRLARQQLHKFNLSNDMSVTTVMHEIYLKFRKNVDEHDSFLDESPDATSKNFYRMCAKAIRNLLIDYCRRSKNKSQITDSIDDDLLNFSWLSNKDRSIELVFPVHEALAKLRAEGFEQEAEIAELRFFMEFTDAEVAKILQISTATVQRKLRFAKAHLGSTLALKGQQ